MSDRRKKEPRSICTQGSQDVSEQVHLLTAALDQIPEGIVVTDSAGRLVFANQTFHKNYCLVSQHLLGPQGGGSNLSEEEDRPSFGTAESGFCCRLLNPLAKDGLFSAVIKDSPVLDEKKNVLGTVRSVREFCHGDPQDGLQNQTLMVSDLPRLDTLRSAEDFDDRVFDAQMQPIPGTDGTVRQLAVYEYESAGPTTGCSVVVEDNLQDRASQLTQDNKRLEAEIRRRIKIENQLRENLKEAESNYRNLMAVIEKEGGLSAIDKTASGGVRYEIAEMNEERETRQAAAFERDPLDMYGNPGQYRSALMRSVVTMALISARTDSIVLLLGESGTGKDYFARFIHGRSSRATGPYFFINCASVAHDLAESELFGHEAGAFTGANKRKRGLLELAEGGTLLLNEIGELPPPVQAKLLTFLDTRKFTRVGGERHIRVNARLLAATNRDLREDVAQGRFRKDLFYRLNVLSIKLPALRDRTEDLPQIVRELLSDLALQIGLPYVPVADAQLMRALAKHDWPGNIRELRNVLERAIMLSGGKRLNASVLEMKSKGKPWSMTLSFPEGESLNAVSRQVKHSLLVEALRRSGGNRTKAARMLGISRYSVINYMKQFAMTVDEVHVN
ncbi:MAG TPA: sigma 54-interacting transcriptional regulator [Desulfomonilaceae bacterium]|nr:sigma 54-interacting transcriptional regulator [Desulfomonilaceae bacterium]